MHGRSRCITFVLRLLCKHLRCLQSLDLRYSLYCMLHVTFISPQFSSIFCSGLVKTMERPDYGHEPVAVFLCSCLWNRSKLLLGFVSVTALALPAVSLGDAVGGNEGQSTWGSLATTSVDSSLISRCRTAFSCSLCERRAVWNATLDRPPY